LSHDLEAIERGLEQALESGLTPGRDAAGHLIGLGGKRVRPDGALAQRCMLRRGVACGSGRLALVAELLHSATLLHDDVVDEGMERRGGRDRQAHLGATP
jgi:octaprenyl-diphosphate synthase